MDKLFWLLIGDSLFLFILVCLLAYHVRSEHKERRKTEAIQQELEQEQAKTEKFHVEVEDILKLTKG